MRTRKTKRIKVQMAADMKTANMKTAMLFKVQMAASMKTAMLSLQPREGKHQSARFPKKQVIRKVQVEKRQKVHVERGQRPR